jgi:hypothetical protein
VSGLALRLGTVHAGQISNELTQQKAERKTTMRRQAMKFEISAIALGCAALIAGCGGGGGGASDGGKAQALTFNFPGGPMVGIPPKVTTTKLVAVASGGGAVTFTSNTPTTCTVSGDTLTLLKAGECSVTANQAGGNGYAAVSQTQLFVIPKNPQVVTFRNPGTLPLDSTPLPLVGTSNIAGQTVVFTSSTPTVCSVSGSSLQKLANGICTITATAGTGDDIYATAKVVRNIPIGTAQADPLTFLTGYKDTSHTKEGGGIGGGGGTSEAGWWCEGSDDKTGAFSHCTSTVAADGSSFTFDFTSQLAAAPDGRWIGGSFDMFALAPGLDKLTAGADTTVGLHIDAQAAVKFNFTQDPEWFGSNDKKVKVQLILGHHAMVPDSNNPGKMKDCNVTLQSIVTPTSTSPTDYSLNLKSFTIADACGMTGLDPWIEMQDYPISKVDFVADSVNVTKVLSGTTKTVRTRGTLTGPIIFQ